MQAIGGWRPGPSVLVAGCSTAASRRGAGCTGSSMPATPTLTNRHGAAKNGNMQTMWPCPGSAVHTELYGYSGGSGTPIAFYPRTVAYRNNGYGVSSLGNRHAGSDVAAWT